LLNPFAAINNLVGNRLGSHLQKMCIAAVCFIIVLASMHAMVLAFWVN